MNARSLGLGIAAVGTVAAALGWFATRQVEGPVGAATRYAEFRRELRLEGEEAERRGTKEVPRLEGAIGSRRDDPIGRMAQERMQLQDPSTGAIPRGMRERERAFAQELQRAARRQSADDAGSARAVSTWSNRGIWNQGGRTRTLALDASDGTARTLLAGGISGGLWRTVNDGQSWTLVTGGTDLYSPTCLAQDTRSGRLQTWYCGTGEFTGNSAAAVGAAYYGTGVWKSADGGQSWSLLAATSPGSPTGFDSGFDYVWSLAIDPSNAAQDEVYAATVGGVQRSLDGGQSWSFVKGSLSGQQISYQTDVAVTPTGVVYLALDSGGPDKGIWRSTDGASYTKIDPPQLGSTFGRIVLGLAPSNPNTLWALVAPAGQGSHKLFKYSADANSWADRSSQLSGLPVAADNNNWTFDSQGGYDMVMTVKPDDENAVFIGGVHLIRSTDQFQSAGARRWVGGWLYPDPNGQSFEQHSDQHALIFHPTNRSIAYSGSDGGVWKTTNILAPTVEWTSLNNGYLTTQFYHAAIDEGTAGSPVINCGLQDNGCWTVHSASANASWIDQFGGDGCYVHVADGATSGGNYYFSSQYAFIYRIVLGANGSFGGQFQRVDPASLTDSNVLFVNPSAIDPNDTRRLYVASKVGLWRANDATAISTPNPNSETDNGWVQVTNRGNEYVTAIAVSRSPANIVYYAGYDLGGAGGKMYKITNASNAPAGTSPTVITGSNFPTGAYINCIAIDPTNADRVLIAFSNYRISSLFYTTNGGTSWTEVEGNLGGTDGPSVRSCLIMPAGGSTVFFAGTSIGLFSTSSLNGAATDWTQEGPGEIRDLVVSWLVGRVSDATVVAATHGGGAFTATVTGGSAACNTRSGDANGNNQVDVTDLTSVVNHILEQQILSAQARLCVDVANDDTINVLDLIQIVRIILGLPLSEDRGVAPSPLAWSRAWNEGQLSLHFADHQMAALECELQLPQGARLADAPRVRGADPDDLQWNLVGRRLVLLLQPEAGLAARGAVDLDLSFRLEGAGTLSEPLLARLIAANPEGRELTTLEQRDLPGGLELLSLGPNPSPGSVELRYRLSGAQAVRASIYDASGREVRALRAPALPGEQSLTWDGRDAAGRGVASGTYFVRLEAGGMTVSRSVRILR